MEISGQFFNEMVTTAKKADSGSSAENVSDGKDAAEASKQPSFVALLAGMLTGTTMQEKPPATQLKNGGEDPSQQQPDKNAPGIPLSLSALQGIGPSSKGIPVIVSSGATPFDFPVGEMTPDATGPIPMKAGTVMQEPEMSFSLSKFPSRVQLPAPTGGAAKTLPADTNTPRAATPYVARGTIKQSMSETPGNTSRTSPMVAARDPHLPEKGSGRSALPVVQVNPAAPEKVAESGVPLMMSKGDPKENVTVPKITPPLKQSAAAPVVQAVQSLSRNPGGVKVPSKNEIDRAESAVPTSGDEIVPVDGADSAAPPGGKVRVTAAGPEYPATRSEQPKSTKAVRDPAIREGEEHAINPAGPTPDRSFLRTTPLKGAVEIAAAPKTVHAKPPGSVTAKTAATIIDQLVKAVNLDLRSGSSSMRIVLVPESLGEVTINVSVEKGKVAASIDASTPATRAILESNVQQLQQALTSRGLVVDRIDIFSSSSSAQREHPQESGRGRPAVPRNEEPGDEEELRSKRFMGYNTLEITL